MVSVHCPRCRHSVRVKRWNSTGYLKPGPVPEPARETLAPAGAGGAGDGHADDDDDDGSETYIYDEHGRLVPAEWTEDGRLVPARRPSAAVAPARPQIREITWADALAALGWHLEPVSGGCQVRTPDGICGAEVSRYTGSGWICARHHSMLCSVIARRSRNRLGGSPGDMTCATYTTYGFPG